MITLRKARERGRTQIGWLDSWHTFSFGEYYDPAHMGFRALRVINDDVVKPASGFGTHPHRDMEIVTWVLDGGLEHKDSLGNGDTIRPGDAQRMTAGTGILHSEWNPSKTDAVHLLQIWIQPDRRGAKPSWEQRHFPREGRQGRWQRIADGAGRDGALAMGADASVLVTELAAGGKVAYEPEAGRALWLHVARGSVTANGHALGNGDALALEGEAVLTLEASASSELLLFDLR